ncbi:MAG: putative cytosolic protein [Burkholderiaceae bacterium]|nr:putative cytosolic protein [Burkholderiaceae bacterium]
MPDKATSLPAGPAVPAVPASRATTASELFQPIGVIHSEHRQSEKTPVQPVFAQQCVGYVELLPEYSAGLAGIEGFSHLYLIYHLHLAPAPKLTVQPFLGDGEYGVFATRFPARPNPLGLSVVELLRREGNRLLVRGVDILDGTPLLDIKPYSARFDHITAERNGWMDMVDDETAMRRGLRGYSMPE